MGSARVAVKVLAAAADVARPVASGFVVLIYHRVGAHTDVEVDLPLDLFERQMQWLVQNCTVVTLDDGLHAVRSTGPLERTIVAVTFDDGTADFVDLAVPTLDRLSVPATLYVATRFVDRGEPFPGGAAPVSWNGLRDVCSTGLIDIGSHTDSHALLDRVSAADVASELDRSIDLIGSNLGAGPRHFAYPKAVLGSTDAEEAVRSRFASAALAGTRANPFGKTDAYRLARSPVQASDGMRWFARKVHGGMALEDSLRKCVNRLRYRNLST